MTDLLVADWPTITLLEERYIRRVMIHVRGNKVHACKLLGISRKTLYLKLKSYTAGREQRCSP